MKNYISAAKQLGFTDAALLPVEALVVVPEYRAFCEQNLCGNYGVLPADGMTELLMMGAGPWKNASCMSAYCVDAQKMADAVHMTCWANDGKIRYFSLILF